MEPTFGVEDQARPGGHQADPIGDLAGPQHWDAEWGREKIASTFGKHWPDRALRRYLAAHVAPRDGESLLELGAGNSRYLAGFARHFGLSVAGLDYSSIGLRMTQAILERDGAHGELAVADLFHPPLEWEQRFDIVFTMGVVEHFEDTPAVLQACARYLRPGGRILTVIPNMAGVVGLAERWLNRPLYEKHRSLTAADLASAHVSAGLELERASYLVAFDAWVVNPSATPRWWKRWLWKPALAATRLIWLLDEWAGLPHTAVFSPWVVVVARRP